MAKIACFVPKQEMERHANYMAEKHEITQFDAVYTKTAQVCEKAREALRGGADIFIARGVQASLLKATFDTPVVEVRLTGQEMAILVMEARQMIDKPRPRIAVVGLHNMFCDISSFPRLFDIELQEYFVEEVRQIEEATLEAVGKGADVLIGGEVCCALADARGVPCVFLESGQESLGEAMRVAKGIAYASDLEKSNTAEMRTILDYSFNGIIKINREGQIIYMNHMAEGILQMDEREAARHPIAQLIPDLREEMLDQVFGGEEIYSTLIAVNHVAAVANIAPIVTGGENAGAAIISFYEREQVEEMQEEIRRGLYRGGEGTPYQFSDLVGSSRELLQAVEQAKYYAKFQAPILITGEPGTEKELLARCIHHANPLYSGSFVHLSCDSLPPEELDAAIFGISKTQGDKQAGLLDAAERGMLFIDRVEQLPLYTQYKLYSLLQKQTIVRGDPNRPLPVNTRIVAGSDENLISLVKKGLFREDLFYALNVLNLHLPGLRHRREDILAWVRHYVGEFSKRYSRYIRITDTAGQILAGFEWDGNLPQIRSFCERLVMLSPKRIVNDRFVREQLQYAYPIIRRNKTGQVVIYKDPKEAQLAELKEECGGNRALMAERLGVSKSTLWRYLKKYGLDG